MKTSVLLSLFALLVVAVLLTGCTQPAAKQPSAPQEPQAPIAPSSDEAALDEALGDIDDVETELDTSDLDGLDQDLVF